MHYRKPRLKQNNRLLGERKGLPPPFGWARKAIEQQTKTSAPKQPLDSMNWSSSPPQSCTPLVLAEICCSRTYAPTATVRL
jgi:hypothetical protein